jgi:DNA modification methylase
VRLYRGDCLEVMPGLAPASIDLVLADPPYGTTACKWDAVIPFAPLWAELRRVAKPNAAIVLFAAQPFTSALVMSNPREFRYEWVWRKSRKTGHLDAKRRPLRAHELICLFARSQTYYAPQMHRDGKPRRVRGEGASKNTTYGAFVRPREMDAGGDLYYPNTVLDFPSVPRPRHPNEKPVPLLAYLIRTYSRPGDVVLDFCFGSGNSGVAALNEGRDYIGIERDPGYYAAAVPYIAAAQPPLFAEVAD